MWSVASMSKALDWDKRRFDNRPKTSITDEAEYRKSDLAARWLAKAELREQKWKQREAKRGVKKSK